MNLVERLKEKQNESGLSEEEFANQKLGIERVSWWNIRTGKRNIGPQVLAAILREYPDLQATVLDYILETNPKQPIAA